VSAWGPVEAGGQAAVSSALRTIDTNWLREGSAPRNGGIRLPRFGHTPGVCLRLRGEPRSWEGTAALDGRPAREAECNCCCTYELRTMRRLRSRSPNDHQIEYVQVVVTFTVPHEPGG
jgi:hypothetical protein